MDNATFTVSISYNSKVDMWNVVVIKPNGLVVGGIQTDTPQNAMLEARYIVARSMAEKAQFDCW